MRTIGGDHALTLFFDGGCRPNPGAIEIAVVCRGVVSIRTDLGNGDNSEAEWLALIEALDMAVARGAADILLVGDSRVVIEQARGSWPCRSAHLKPYHAAFLAKAAGIGRLRLRHVRRSKNLAGIALARRGLR